MPKGQQRINIDEWALQTCKSHTIGSLSAVVGNFPLGLWEKLISQLDMQVDILWLSNVNPNVCSWTVLNGAHDFNRNQLEPLNVKIQMLENHYKRKTGGVRIKARLLCWCIIGTLPLLLGLDERDQENKRIRYCDFKTQMHHKSFRHNSQCHCECIQATHQCPAWNYPPSTSQKWNW